MIYLDHAASSWPKPETVAQAMHQALTEYAANPGRGSHLLAVQASQVIRQTRELLADFFGVSDPRQMILCSGATYALNQAIKGLRWKKGDKVLATSYEHNAVRRPLEYIKREYGVEVHYVQADHNGQLPIQHIDSMLDANTKLIVMTHVSNLTGAILPLEEMGRLAHKHRIPLLVDASQSAGYIPIQVEEMGISMLAFPGHKGLYGPQGTGGLYVAPDLDLIPLVHGGTGGNSELEDQPLDRPERYESGTVNTPGIAGLGAGVKFLLEKGLDKVFQRKQELVHYALEKMKQLEGIELYGPDLGVERAPVIAFNIQGIDPQELAFILDQHYQIAVRAGLHCTPLGHESIQTGSNGAVRASFGYYNTQAEIDQFVRALDEIRVGMLG